MLMLFGAAVALLVVLAMVLIAVAAYMRAEDAREQIRILQKRLAAVEKHVGIERARPVAKAAESIDGQAQAHPDAAPAETTSIEERIALIWLARIGAGILVLGAFFFLFFGPTGGQAGAVRLGIAVASGAAALAFAEVIRKRARPLFNQVMLGLGAAVLAFAAIASHRLYHLAPPGIALAAAAAVFALGGALAVRHGTQVPMVLALAGALAAPAVLRVDLSAAALFAYLLATSTAALALAVWRGLAVARWCAPLGVFAALLAWYVASFDSQGAEAVPGHGYQLLSERWVPLSFAAAFVASWIAGYVQLRRAAKAPRGPVPFLVMSLVLGHLLFAALVYDQPPVITAAFAGLAVAGAWLLRREDPWAVLPVLALSFLLLLGAVHAKAPGVTFVPLAVWGIAYASALAQGQRPISLVLCGVAGSLFLVVAGELLAPLRWISFGLVTVAWSVAYAWLAMVRRAPLLLAGTAFVSFFGLLGAAAPIREHGDVALLLISGGWVLVHFGGLAFRIRSQQETPERVHVASASGVGVAYGALVLFLAPDEPLLRGALAAASGACHIALGGLLLQRAPKVGNALQAVAVGLFAVAAMHALPGASSTLAWAVLATLLVWAGFQRHSRLLRFLGLGLFAATIVRVAVYDLWRVTAAYEVAVLLAVGGLLLFASYLYARLGAKLAEVMREGRAPEPGVPPQAPAPRRKREPPTPADYL